MESNIPAHQKNVSTFIHLSTFCKYLFPFGNFIAPLILWSAQKRNSRFIDAHGRGAINFQLSILMYMIIVAVISIPFFVYQILLFDTSDSRMLFNGHVDHIENVSHLSGFFITVIIVAILITAIFLVEIISVISAAVKASGGNPYSYPLTINFIKESAITEDTPIETQKEEKVG